MEQPVRDDLYKITIALAGMAQAIALVKELAQTGKTDDTALEASLYSIFQTDPKDLPSVYGGLANLRIGIENLISAFSGNPEQGQSLMRYVISLIHLQKKITNTSSIQDTLSRRIHQAKKQVDYFSLTHPTVISSLADIYMSTISTFKFRIMIWGNPRTLNSPDIMEKIRALLLAGVRSAVLWRQIGGSRLQLLFFRKKINATAEKILSQIKQHEINEKERL
jgi:high frequency lysogenization protein